MGEEKGGREKGGGKGREGGRERDDEGGQEEGWEKWQACVVNKINPQPHSPTHLAHAYLRGNHAGRIEEDLPDVGAPC